MPVQSAAITIPVGKTWAQCYTRRSGGQLADISTSTFEFVIRPSTSDLTEPALISVSSAAPSSQGVITVDTATASVMVQLTYTATLLLAAPSYSYSLWAFNGASRDPWATGPIFPQPVAQP
jgi:hypothetical protein